MKIYSYIISYDISDNKRLSNTAKLLAQVSIRIQKSIYFYQTGLNSELKTLIDLINKIISDEDDVRIYKIDIDNSISINSAVDLKKPTLIGDIDYEKYL